MVTTTNLNFRTGPSTSNNLISTIPEGTVVEVISTENGWSKIKYNSKEGYVSASYLKDYTGDSSDSSSNTTLPSSKPLYAKTTIVIDPGHGGHDPGAIGFGRNEKDIALSISKKINANLKTLGYKTIMTRSTDVYVTLADRYTIANNNNADMFVSIHLNSASSSSAKGIETLYKNSKTFANDIQTEMIAATSATNRGLKNRTDLAVLNGTKMAAALVETGFISNSDESAKLATTSYQDTLAASIAKGIAKYTDSNISK
jgi:N-acetylmuramoyl-L-alanine amidase